MTTDAVGGTGLLQIVYASEATEPVAGALLRILEPSRRNNGRDGVSSALLFASIGYLQLLEGPSSHVLACMARISCDPRHQRVYIVGTRLSQERTELDALRLVPASADVERAMGRLLWFVRTQQTAAARILADELLAGVRAAQGETICA